MPLTKEQFDKLDAEGFSPEEIASFEQKRQGTQQQPMQESAQPQQKPSALSQLTRFIMSNSPMEQMGTTSALAKQGMPDVQQGQSLSNYQQTVAQQLQPREQQIQDQGSLAQLELPMQMGLAVSGAEAPMLTAKMLAKFGLLEGIAEGLGVNKAIQGIQNSTMRDAADIAKFIAQGAMATEKWTPGKNPRQLDLELRATTEKELAGIGVKPSPMESKQFGSINKFYDKANNAIKSIYEAKENLRYSYPDGTQGTGLPKNLYEFSQAIPQTRKMVYEAYNAATQQATGQGVKIDTAKTAQAILESVATTERQLLDPSIQNYALSLADRMEKQKSINPQEAENLIAEVNTTLTNYNKNPSEELRTKAFVDAAMAADIRAQLDSGIEGATGIEYQALKNKYGELRQIEKYVNRSMLRNKENPAGVTDFINTFGTADILQGILTGDVGGIIRGSVIKGGMRFFKNMKEPNARTERLFTKLDEIEGAKIINNKVSDWRNRQGVIANLVSKIGSKAAPIAGIAAVSTLANAGNAQAMENQTLGQRNNNPINLKAFENWEGMKGKDKHNHAQFKTLEHGIRAALVNLNTHKRKKPDETLRQYMRTFKTKKGDYQADYIAKELKISPDAKLKDVNMSDVLIPLARIESRIKLSREQIAAVKRKFNLKQ